jgi:hypothetical protein
MCNLYYADLWIMPTIGSERALTVAIVRNGADGRELATARWGMPSSQHALMEATKNRASGH